MPLLPLSYPHHWEGAVGDGDTQRGRPHSAPKLKGRNGFIGEEVTILPHPHRSSHLHIVHVLRGGTMGPGIFSGAPHLPVAAVEGPGGGGDGWGAPSQAGCPGPGSGGGGSGGAAWAVPESEQGEVGSGPPAGLGVGTEAAAVPVGGGPGRGDSAPGGCSVGVAACMIFWRTSRIFNCRQTLEGKMSA